jgi:hypothetical protein
MRRVGEVTLKTTNSMLEDTDMFTHTQSIERMGEEIMLLDIQNNVSTVLCI